MALAISTVIRAAEVQAKLSGMSLEEWVSRAVAERLDTSEGAREFFRQRAAAASGDALGRALDAIPSHPPLPGDEL